MSRIARDNAVLFIESLGLRRPQFAGRDLRRMAKRLQTGFQGVRMMDGVAILSPLVIPLHSNAAVSSLNKAILHQLVRRAVRRLGMNSPILWAYVPQAESLVDAIRPSRIVYHCVDDIAAQKGVDAASFRAAETRFASRADLVIASSRPLADRMATLNENVIYAPNVADVDLFATALEPGPIDPALADISSPRLLFVGAITATKLDLELLEGVARQRPEWQFVLAGPVGVGDPSTDVSSLSSLPNVHIIGSRSQQELPRLLRGCSAGLIPYAQNQLTASVFPMKVYEYMAAGLPVIATSLPTLEGVEGVVFADDSNASVEAIDHVLEEDDASTRQARSLLARGHSWEARLDEIDAALREVGV